MVNNTLQETIACLPKMQSNTNQHGPRNGVACSYSFGNNVTMLTCHHMCRVKNSNILQAVFFLGKSFIAGTHRHGDKLGKKQSYMNGSTESHQHWATASHYAHQIHSVSLDKEQTFLAGMPGVDSVEETVPEPTGKRFKSGDPVQAAKHRKWQEQHDQFRSEQKVEWVPWTGSMEGVTTDRIKDLIHTAHSCLVAQGRDVKNFFVDVSQSLGRSPWCSTLRTFTTSSTYFSFAKGGILHPATHLSILGLEFEGTYTPTAYKCPAGEAMAAPCVALATPRPPQPCSPCCPLRKYRQAHRIKAWLIAGRSNWSKTKA
eukprot:5977982-Amphidinium_carterae.4